MQDQNKIKDATEVLFKNSKKVMFYLKDIDLNNRNLLQVISERNILGEISKCLDQGYSQVRSSYNLELLNAIYIIGQECKLNFAMPEKIIKGFVVKYLASVGCQQKPNPNIIEIIKLFIKNERISRFHPLKDNRTRDTEIDKWVTDIYLADWISGVIPVDLELKEKLHEYLYSNPEDKLKDLGQKKEAEQKDFIERIKHNYEWVKESFNPSHEKISLLSEELLSKIINKIPNIEHLVLSSCTQEELKCKEADILHKLLGIYPAPLADILNSELNRWKEKDDGVKEKTLNFYLEIYKDFPEVIKVIEKLRQKENFEIIEEEKTNCIKCLNENIGLSFTKIPEKDIEAYMVYDNSIVESIYSMAHNISLKKPVQESLRAIYQGYEKLDPKIIHKVQKAFQYQRGTNQKLEMEVESLERKCEKQQEEIRKLQDQVSELFRLVKNPTVVDTGLATFPNELPEYYRQSFFNVLGPVDEANKMEEEGLESPYCANK